MSTTAEIMDALELAMARIGCPPGDNADADIYHRLSSALALLAGMERGGELVAWMHQKTKDTQSDEWVRYWRLEGMKYPNGANADGYSIPLYTHPSPQPSVEVDSGRVFTESEVRAVVTDVLRAMAARDRDMEIGAFVMPMAERLRVIGKEHGVSLDPA